MDAIRPIRCAPVLMVANECQECSTQSKAEVDIALLACFFENRFYLPFAQFAMHQSRPALVVALRREVVIFHSVAGFVIFNFCFDSDCLLPSCLCLCDAWVMAFVWRFWRLAFIVVICCSLFIGIATIVILIPKNET